jgi:hypothetical protein
MSLRRWLASSLAPESTSGGDAEYWRHHPVMAHFRKLGDPSIQDGWPTGMNRMTSDSACEL